MYNKKRRNVLSIVGVLLFAFAMCLFVIMGIFAAIFHFTHPWITEMEMRLYMLQYWQQYVILVGAMGFSYYIVEKYK